MVRVDDSAGLSALPPRSARPGIWQRVRLCDSQSKSASMTLTIHSLVPLPL